MTLDFSCENLNSAQTPQGIPVSQPIVVVF
jgi:hypothetical protein